MVSKNVKPNPGHPEKSALLIIDVQRGQFANPNAVYKEDELVANILELADRAHRLAFYPSRYIGKSIHG